MNVSITTNNFKTIEMIASDVGILPHAYNLWNAVLNEEYYRKSDYDVFREFCDKIIYKKPRPESVAISKDDYYLSIPVELIDSIFVHETRCECGVKKGVNY